MFNHKRFSSAMFALFAFVFITGVLISGCGSGELASGGIIRGRITDADTGGPIAGVSVSDGGVNWKEVKYPVVTGLNGISFVGVSK